MSEGSGPGGGPLTAATEGRRRIPPLGAGRRAAGLALMGWLDDPLAPPLCVVTGSPGSGRAHLLAWLVRAGTTSATPYAQRIHAAVPAAGQTVRSVSWTLGRQLGRLVHSPEELLAVLADDERRTVICVAELDQAAEPNRLIAELISPLTELPQIRLVVEASRNGPAAESLIQGWSNAVVEPALLDLDDPRWTDRDAFNAWCARKGADPEGYPVPGRALGMVLPDLPYHPGLGELLASVPRGADDAQNLRAADPELLSELWRASAREGRQDLLTTDPLLYALAGPVAVTAATEGLGDAVSRAWSAAGPALIDEPSAAVRASVLRVRLLGSDDTAAARLASLPAHWSGRWMQAAAVADCTAVGSGPQEGQLLIADPSGTVRSLAPATGQRAGAILVPDPRPLRALAQAADGSLLLLDSWGGVALLPSAQPEQLSWAEHLAEGLTAVRERTAGELSTLAVLFGATFHGSAFGDTEGTVHWHDGGEVRSELLHDGPVTALAGTVLDSSDSSAPDLPLLASGGADGAVRLWGPWGAPMAEASDSRDCAVTAVTIGWAHGEPLVAAAWTDGTVRVRYLTGTSTPYDLCLGSPCHSLALVDGLLILAARDGLTAVDPGVPVR